MSNLQVICPHIFKYAVASLPMCLHVDQKFLQRNKQNPMGVKRNKQKNEQAAESLLLQLIVYTNNTQHTEVVYS